MQVAERSNSGKHWVQVLCPSDNEKMLGASSRKMKRKIENWESGMDPNPDAENQPEMPRSRGRGARSTSQIPNAQTQIPNTPNIREQIQQMQNTNTANTKYD